MCHSPIMQPHMRPPHSDLADWYSARLGAWPFYHETTASCRLPSPSQKILELGGFLTALRSQHMCSSWVHCWQGKHWGHRRTFLSVRFSDLKPLPMGVVMGAFSPILCFCECGHADRQRHGHCSHDQQRRDARTCVGEG